jgi:YHS domain-containing protein/mono/diheme cytochrome c family protein
VIDADSLYHFAGRLHPLVLHAPIGIAIALLALEGVALLRRQPPAREARLLLAWLFALSAAAAVGSGLVLASEGGHSGTTIQIHKWTAIGVGVVSLLGALLLSARRAAGYSLCLLAAGAALVPAGHFGASMTHGADFLFEPFQPRPDPVFVSNPVDAGAGAGGVYARVVAPILEARCVSCHGADRAKGSLRLDSPEGILRGGELGPALVAGDAATSEMVARMRLPMEHDDHMPPRSKPQPTEAEIAALEAWISAGASFASDPAQVTAAAPTLAPAAPAEPAPAPDAALADIRARLVHVEPIARGSSLLLLDTAAVAPSVNDSALAELLEPVRGNVAELAVARAAVTDRSMDLIGALPRLRRLNLTGTAITDAGLEKLHAHPAIEELVVTQTQVSDLSYDLFASLPKLKRLYLWKSRVTPETIAELRTELAGVVIDAGDTPDAAVLPEAPAPSADAIAAAVAAALRPMNAMCPVSGKPIDPKFAVVHEGKVIGFCCEHCLADFAADPAKYAEKLKQ